MATREITPGVYRGFRWGTPVWWTPWRRYATNSTATNKTKTSEFQNPTIETPKSSVVPQRYDEAIKHQAVENWIKSGKRGTQRAAELTCVCAQRDIFKKTLSILSEPPKNGISASKA
jgi:hypothetical protein